jgi:nicotinate-nucleotide pyrophosphorylase (carboxylating)
MEFLAEELDKLIDLALREDIGDGDLTTRASVDPNLNGEADILFRSGGVLAGQSIARRVFKTVDKSLRYAPMFEDGSVVEAGIVIATVTGNLASILTAERTALNFLMRLSGNASLTKQFVDRVEGTNVKILDTRKTTPGMRQAEKHAVVCGGGYNHRRGLYDMILIKDNHIRASGSLFAAVKRCTDYRDQVKPNIKIEVEASSPIELEQALQSGASWIMLDNMSIDQIRDAVEKVRAVSTDIKIEVSGGVSLDTVRKLAECGIDYISVGALTHSAPASDFSLNVVRITG